jgi:superfamily I DNA/RNA helicase
LVSQANTSQIAILKVAATQAKLSLFLSFLEGFGKKLEGDPKNISSHIAFWVDSLKYKDEIKKSARDVEDEERRHENIKRFGILAQDIMDRGDITTIPDLLDYISLMQDAGMSTAEDDRVHLMTAHSSKGLEYEVVFAPCFFEGAIPHKKSLRYPEEVAEEARLVYVIFTRAIRQLRVSRPLLFSAFTGPKGKGKPTQIPTLRSRFFEPVRKVFQDYKNTL